MPDPPPPPSPPQPPVYYGCVNLYRVLLPTCHCFALRFLGQRRWRWVRTDSRGDARAWLGEAVIQTLNVVFRLYLTSYLAQEDARQLFECRTPSLVHTHHLVVCRPPTTEILTENGFQRGCWVATAGDCTITGSAARPTCLIWAWVPARLSRKGNGECIFHCIINRTINFRYRYFEHLSEWCE